MMPQSRQSAKRKKMGCASSWSAAVASGAIPSGSTRPVAGEPDERPRCGGRPDDLVPRTRDVAAGEFQNELAADRVRKDIPRVNRQDEGPTAADDET